MTIGAQYHTLCNLLFDALFTVSIVRHIRDIVTFVVRCMVEVEAGGMFLLAPITTALAFVVFKPLTPTPFMFSISF